MKHKKTLIIFLILFLVFAGFVGYYFLKNSKSSKGTEKVIKTEQTTDINKFLIEGYPLDTVPLYKMKIVSSSKYFVNDDPSGTAGYLGHPKNYFNVVFETEATPQELLAYYGSLMSEKNEDLSSDEQIEGKIGKYKVSASHYGNNPKNYAYLQVYLPSDEYREQNLYFKDYPSVVEIDKTWTEFESSYGLLNQKGGEVEYTQYFPFAGDDEDRRALLKKYQEKYQSETGYTFDEKSGLMTWKKDNFSVSLTFSKSHGRVYLMIRRPMKG